MSSELKSIIMKRDGLTSKEADDAIRWAKSLVADGMNPEEVLEEEFGLEPDYFFDIIP